MSRDQVTLRWNSVPRRHYRVQFTNNLDTRDWQSMTEIVADADHAEVTQLNQAAFYRLQIMVPPNEGS